MTELGYPEVDLDGWFGDRGSGRSSADIVNALYTKFAGVLNAPDLNGKLKEQGWVVDPIIARTIPRPDQKRYRSDSAGC